MQVFFWGLMAICLLIIFAGFWSGLKSFWKWITGPDDMPDPSFKSALYLFAAAFVVFCVDAILFGSSLPDPYKDARQACADTLAREKGFKPDSLVYQAMLHEADVKKSGDLNLKIDYKMDFGGPVYFHCISNDSGKTFAIYVDNDPWNNW